MPLPLSGTIKLSDVRTEVGGAGAISLGGVTARNMANIATGAIKLSNLYGASGYIPAEHWIATVGGTPVEYGSDVAIDSSGNVYSAAYSGDGIGGDQLVLAKYSPQGVLQWYKMLSGSYVTSSPYSSGYGRPSIAVDSLDNIYLTGGGLSSVGGYATLVIKLNSSGAFQWQQTLQYSSNASNEGYAIVVDTSNNVYVVGSVPGHATFNGARSVLIAKYNSSGTKLWHNLFGISNTGYLPYAAAVDSSGNIYVVGDTGTTSMLLKCNTSGTFQWGKKFTGSMMLNVTVDLAGNIYVTGPSLIAKFNSAGTSLWSYKLSGTNSRGYSLSTDAAGDLYLSGTTYVSGEIGLLVKITSAGAISWQRTFVGASLNAMYVGGTAIYVSGLAGPAAGGGSSDLLTVKLPTDGSLEGTYGMYTYAASNLTLVASGVTVSALTFSTVVSPALVGTVPSPTITSPTYKNIATAVQ